jgi:hypothetical protein
MKIHAMICLLAIAVCAPAAPIPKSLKKKSKNFDYEGYWEVMRENINGAPSPTSNGKYWKIEKDKFYYLLKETNTESSGSSCKLETPDETEPQLKVYNKDTRCRLEIDQEQLTWVFANSKTDPLEDCTPGKDRVIYYFKRVN